MMGFGKKQNTAVSICDEMNLSSIAAKVLLRDAKRDFSGFPT